MSEPLEISRFRKKSSLSIDQVEIDDQTVVVCLEGDLDLWSSPQLKRVLCDLLDAGRTRLVLDLARVAFMDSTALGVMVGIHRRITGVERLAIAAPTPPVLRVFELSGLATGFRVFTSRETALSYVTETERQTGERVAPPLTADAALMLGIASTAMPFAQSAEDQAERWLRALRNHGEAGAVLASLGLNEAVVNDLDRDGDGEPSGPGDPDPVATVTAEASRITTERGGSKLGTAEVLRAVIQVYGPTFYRVLTAHGVDPAELTARLASADPAPAEH